MAVMRISVSLAGLGVCLAATVATAQIAGDYNKDGQLDAADLDLQAMQIVGDGDLFYDLNNDGVVDYADRQVWINDLKNTWMGDANLDLVFNSSDLVQVFQRGKYETTEYALWEEGDWNGDMKFNGSDFVATFGSCYEPPCGIRSQWYAVAVPEPAALLLLVLGTLVFTGVRRRH